MLKSHDCHILIEQLLPLAMRTALSDEVSSILIELCSFFRQLCGKALKVEDLDKLQNKVVLTLCHMEMLFYYVVLKAYFVVNDGDNKKYILSSMGKKWQDHKCRLFTKYYNWALSLEENIRNHPPHVNKDQWAVYIRHRRSPKAMEIADKNASNREKLFIPHTLGSKTLVRKRDELELQDGRQYTRGEMYPISHKKKDGSFVNEEARQINEQLQKEIHESSSENAAFLRVFGKEHPGYVRGMGLGITPTQINGARLESSSQSNAKIEQMQAEIDVLKEQVAEVDVLKEQIAFLMRNAKGNQLDDLESPRVDARRSSESSHVPQDHATSSRGTI